MGQAVQAVLIGLEPKQLESMALQEPERVGTIDCQMDWFSSQSRDGRFIFPTFYFAKLIMYRKAERMFSRLSASPVSVFK
jgi:hypothetical protein